MPFELFDDLLEGLNTDPARRDPARAVIDPQLPVYGYSAQTFWRQLKTRKQMRGKNFDRFLYGVVAPVAMHSGAGSDAERAEQLRFIARSCK